MKKLKNLKKKAGRISLIDATIMNKPAIIIFSIGVFLLSCSRNTAFLKEIKELPAYPSGSGIEYYKDRFYLIGDDATHLLILDKDLNTKDSVLLYESATNRVPREIKADLEAISLIRINDSMKILATGSGSMSPQRDSAWLIDPVTRQKTSLNLDTFYRRIKSNWLAELNIEGLCALPGLTLLSNRGHLGFPKNHLLFTGTAFWKDHYSPITMVKVGVNEDSSIFHGVSGLAYARREDKLFLTVSTENTNSAITDGPIGKSYLWIVDDISSKRRWKAINPNRIVDLEKTDPRFKGQKIESVCITGATKHYFQLALVADNDDGKSRLFLLDVSKK